MLGTVGRADEHGSVDEKPLRGAAGVEELLGATERPEEAAAEALVLHWIEYGAVSPVCNTVLRRHSDAATENRVFACTICRLRFSNPRTCGRHTRLHADVSKRARADAALQQKSALTSLGLFAAFEEKRKIEAARKMSTPLRATSPVRIKDTDALVHAQSCAVCGDHFKKEFSEPHNDFMWAGVVRRGDDTLLHDECARLFFGSPCV